MSSSDGRLCRKITRRQVMPLLASIFGASGSIPTTGARAVLGQDVNLDDLYVPDDVDRAVQNGVKFLMQVQRPSGAINDERHEIAMTSLAIMAMASMGITPGTNSDRGKVMDDALEFVLARNHQDMSGYFGDRDDSRMYGHGIITLMLTELLGMGSSVNQNQRIHESLEDAIKLILAAQAVSKPEKLQGGWRYAPSSRDSDLSVSVWQLMALRSAKNDGMAVPGEAIELALNYLRNSFTSPRGKSNKATEAIGGFSYTPGSHHPTFTMTSAGLLAMQVCGQYSSPMVSASAKWLMTHPPKINERFFYYGLYYYAQGMHQAGDVYAKRADSLVPELLLSAQRSDGSWLGQGGEEKSIGRVYATSLAILSLSVRYHYLPIYQK